MLDLGGGVGGSGITGWFADYSIAPLTGVTLGWREERGRETMMMRRGRGGR